MPDALLFWVPTLIWATTWHALTYQTGVVPITHSIAYRFGLASLMFFAYALAKREKLALGWHWQRQLMVVGVVQFGLNYWCTYEASKVITSGLLAVLFSLMVFSNAIAGHFAFQQKLTRRFFGASLLGVMGVVLIFWPDVAHTAVGPEVWRGIALGLVAVLFATTGNILTLRVTQAQIPLVPVLAYSMMYGALALFLTGIAMGQAVQFDVRPAYSLSLAYLSLVGSFAAFLFYFKLAQRQGPGKAALVGMVIPVVALGVSAVLEGWRPTVVSGLGALCCLGGLWGATSVTKPVSVAS